MGPNPACNPINPIKTEIFAEPPNQTQKIRPRILVPLNGAFGQTNGQNLFEYLKEGSALELKSFWKIFHGFDRGCYFGCLKRVSKSAVVVLTLIVLKQRALFDVPAAWASNFGPLPNPSVLECSFEGWALLF